MDDGEPCPPSSCFSFECSDGSDTREVEEHKQHEREGSEGCERRDSGITSVEDAHSGDDGFFCR